MISKNSFAPTIFGKSFNDNCLGKLKESGMKIIRPDIENFHKLGLEFTKKSFQMAGPGLQTYFGRYLQ